MILKINLSKLLNHCQTISDNKLIMLMFRKIQEILEYSHPNHPKIFWKCAKLLEIPFFDIED